MKTLVKILAIGLLSVLLSIAAKATDKRGNWEPTSVKNKKLFVLKTNKKLVGARVEIVHSGEVIAEQKLNRRKMIIDFENMEEGAYTIRISKGDQVKELEYVNK